MSKLRLWNSKQLLGYNKNLLFLLMGRVVSVLTFLVPVLLVSFPFFFLFTIFVIVCATFLHNHIFFNSKELRTSGTADSATMGHAVLHAPVGFCFHSRSAEGIGFDLRNMPVKLL